MTGSRSRRRASGAVSRRCSVPTTTSPERTSPARSLTPGRRSTHSLRTRRRYSSGRFYELQDAPGLNRPDLPLLVGGSALPGTARPAVRFADEYNVLVGTTDEVRERKRLLDDACLDAGRDPATLRYSLMATCVIGDDESAVRASAGRIAERFGRDPEQVLE